MNAQNLTCPLMRSPCVGEENCAPAMLGLRGAPAGAAPCCPIVVLIGALSATAGAACSLSGDLLVAASEGETPQPEPAAPAPLTDEERKAALLKGKIDQCQ